MVAGRPARGEANCLSFRSANEEYAPTCVERFVPTRFTVGNREPIQKLIRNHAAVASLPSGHVDMGDRPGIRLRGLADSH